MKWTNFEDDVLTELYQYKTSKELAELFGVTRSAIKNRAIKLKLSKPRAGMFKPGHTTWNKGKKIGTFGRAAETQFKKGQAPLNTKQLGTISNRTDKRTGISYQYVKLGDCKWKELHKHLWQQHHGPIEPGMRVVFIDGNTMNCVIDNLECITAQEAMARTRQSDGFIAAKLAINGRGTYDADKAEMYRAHPELLQLKRKQLELQQTIKTTRHEKRN